MVRLEGLEIIAKQVLRHFLFVGLGQGPMSQNIDDYFLVWMEYFKSHEIDLLFEIKNSRTKSSHVPC